MHVTFRAFIVVLCFAMVTIGSAHAGTPSTPAAETAAILVKRVPPRYPAKAVERGQEGWVALSFTVTPEGTTSGIRVVAQYPRNVFARSAINAVAKWVYTPRFDNGIALPQSGMSAVLSFALGESEAVRAGLVPQVAAARGALDDHNWDQAANLIARLGDTESLNLFEAATLEELRGRLALGKHEFATATDNFSHVLQITTKLSPETRDSIAELLVTAAINSGDYPRAVAAFDRWPPPPREQNRELRRAMETIRAALASGQPITLRPLAPPTGD